MVIQLPIEWGFKPSAPIYLIVQNKFPNIFELKCKFTEKFFNSESLFCFLSSVNNGYFLFPNSTCELEYMETAEMMNIICISITVSCSEGASKDEIEFQKALHDFTSSEGANALLKTTVCLIKERDNLKVQSKHLLLFAHKSHSSLVLRMHWILLI